MKLGKKLRNLRLQNQLTQKELAQKMGIKECEIRSIETSKVIPNERTLQLYSRFFDYTVCELSNEKHDVYIYSDTNTIKPNAVLFILHTMYNRRDFDLADKFSHHSLNLSDIAMQLSSNASELSDFEKETITDILKISPHLFNYTVNTMSDETDEEDYINSIFKERKAVCASNGIPVAFVFEFNEELLTFK